MFVVYEKSLELVRLVQKRVVPELRRRGDRELADQVSRAVRSVPLNIAEGAPQRGKRRGNHYCIALGSNREVDACLDLGVVLGSLDPSKMRKVYAVSDEVQAMLYVMSR